MKPSKNSYYCVDCKRSKMLFPSKAKAERFMEYNSDEIYEETGHRPVRAYFCIACGGMAHYLSGRQYTNTLCR
ncbi:MAG: hypothetical protein NC095_02980 [Muribaculum sp.]|nr:hypothetical protein [Muribaculum sp.]